MKKEFLEKEKGSILKKYKYWTLYLSPKQYYLGKLRLILNRENIIDFCDLKKQEIEELRTIIKKSKKALTKCFKPDLFNYATLGNCILHHHWHIIPRYKKKRTFNKITFKDNHWGNPAWPNPTKKIDKKTMDLIKKEISNALQK